MALISGGADVREIAAATSKAAEAGLAAAGADPLLQRAFFLLTQIPLAARREDFAGELRGMGVLVSDQPSLIEICAALATATDRLARRTGQSDLGEMAQLSAVESLIAVAGREMPGLFGHEAQDAHVALAALATEKQFGILARDFFARLTRRYLDYFLSRELPSHVGVAQRLHSLAEHRSFEDALDAHCHETARIAQIFAGEWFSKTTYEGGIDDEKAGRFAHVAFRKIRDELEIRRHAAPA
jgi:hypothetical protein